MYLGYQINERGEEFIAIASNTREELENNEVIKYTRIKEVSDTYELVNGKYINSAEAFLKAKEEKRTEINRARDKAEQGGFTYLNKTFDSDLVSSVRIQGAAQLATQMPMSDTPIIEWTCADNSKIELTAAELLGLSAALANWSNECHKKATELKLLVDAAQTKEELNAISW